MSSYIYNSNLSTRVNEENASLQNGKTSSGGKLASFVAFVIIPIGLIIYAWVSVAPLVEKIITPYMGF